MKRHSPNNVHSRFNRYVEALQSELQAKDRKIAELEAVLRVLVDNGFGRAVSAARDRVLNAPNTPIGRGQ